MKKIIALALAAVMAVTMVACSQKADEPASDVRKITVATSADFPPYEFIDDEQNIVGIDMDIARLIGEKMGAEIELVNMDYNGILSAISTGKYDLGMAAFSITEERKESVLFSDFYATAKQVIVVKEGSPITTVDDLYEEGASYTVGVQLSTTGDIYFSEDIDDELTTCGISQYVKATDLVQALETGKIDCIIIDNAPAESFIGEHPDLKILETEYVEEEYAICTALENTDLIAEVNEALNALIADGSVQKVIDKYITAE